MSNVRTKPDYVTRRGELLAELFFQELEPEFLVRSPADFAYDLLVGFRNTKGGINNIAIGVQATERLSRNRYTVEREQYLQWANSNIPVLFLVVDAKHSRLFFAWPTPEYAKQHPDAETIAVKLTEIDDAAKKALLERFRA